MAGDFGEVPEEGAGEVDEVDALVEHLAAAGDGGVAAPLLFHARAPAVAVAAAEEQEGAEVAGIDDLARLEQGGVEAVVEADLDDEAGSVERLAGGVRDGLELGCVAGGGFLDQDVLTAADGFEGDRGELVVGGGYDD